MTDRVRTLIVELSRETRDDDAEDLMNAIRMIKGVQEVSLGPATTPEWWVARRAAVREIDAVLREALDKLYGRAGR